MSNFSIYQNFMILAAVLVGQQSNSALWFASCLVRASVPNRQGQPASLPIHWLSVVAGALLDHKSCLEDPHPRSARMRPHAAPLRLFSVELALEPRHTHCWKAGSVRSQ